MQISSDILNRKGATKAALLSSEIVALLNKGIIESVNLTEWLAVDHTVLVKHILPEEYHFDCLAALDLLKQKTAMQSTIVVGKALFETTSQNGDNNLFPFLAAHVSDSARCWAAYIVGANNGLTISEKLDAIRPFAADSHFGVREIAWMAVRPAVESDLDEAIAILSEWVKDADANVRRFASEVTRPRGVWCKHIERLKAEPQLGLAILEPLKSDGEKYVRDSVANWLNDSAKTQPEFVKDICSKWSEESKTKETAYIIKKATRSI